jgi:predicted ribosome quality control (RQC) complex YloA/Tae2 family protein
MMLSLLELQRAARLLKKFLQGALLRRIKQTDDEQALILVLEAERKLQVLISCNPQFARICLADFTDSNRSTSSFQEFLRAHLIGSTLAGIEVSGEDRQIRLQFQAHTGAFALILSIQGVRSNIYLLDSQNNLVHSLRPLDDTRRELKLGSPWSNPGGALQSDGVDRWKETPDELYFEELEKTYRRLEIVRTAELLARGIEQVVKKEKNFLDRKYLNLREDLGDAQKAEEYRQKGELLKNVLHAVKPGDESAKTMDYETGQTIEIPLDPRLSPAANLESYFVRYQKESRGATMIGQQLENLEIIRAELEEVERRLQEALKSDLPDLDGLKEIAAQPRIRRLLHRYSPRRKVQSTPAKPSLKKELPSRLTPKRYRTQDGLEIWVGRSDEANDYLTMRLARGNDLFFHLEGYPGSHVILRTEGRSDPPATAVLDACELAVHFSKLKNAGSADVHVAPVKDVKKPKGVKPGLVYVRKGRTIHLRRDPKRLESILAGRFED